MALQAQKLAEVQEFNAQEFAAQAAKLQEMREIDVERLAAEAQKLAEVREFEVQELAAQAAKLQEMREIDVERLAVEARKLQEVHELQAREMALQAMKLREAQEVNAERIAIEAARMRDMNAALADERAQLRQQAEALAAEAISRREREVEAARAMAASPSNARFDGTGSFSWTAEGEQTDVTWTGPFRVSGDGRDVASVEPGASVRFSDGPWELSTGVEVRALADGSLEHTFYRNGTEQPFDAEAHEFLAEMLRRVVRWGGRLR
jgi:hypothetical protein